MTSMKQKIMRIPIALFVADIVLVNLGFVISFLVRYGLSIPQHSFLPYKNSFIFLSLIYVLALSFFNVYRKKFRSSWDLFKRVCIGLFWGTLLSIALIYVFREKWGAFPTSVFILAYFINLLLVFKLNQYVLKAKRRIEKRVVILGEGKVDGIVGKKANVERKRIDQIRELLEYSDGIDEIVISERITNAKDLNLLLCLKQSLEAKILFVPSVYVELMPERINGSLSVHLLSTFVGKRSDCDEFLIRLFDILGALVILLVSFPCMLVIALLVKLSSLGPIIYKQRRAGKDGKVFTLYKIRTMVNNAENILGLEPTKENDPRVTRVGRLLRQFHLDELPQLFNILRGDMSLVGPRPENLYRVEKHKALQGLRLAVKPGLTGLAQIRSFYDLQPKHKIKYDYLYIQRRSFWLNMYIILLTIPAVFIKKGW